MRVVAQWVVLAVALGLAVVLLVDRWAEVSEALGKIGPARAAGALAAAGAAVLLTGEQQRALLSAWGHGQAPAPWARVFLTAQLGKYLPGTGWAYVAQMELAKERGVGRGMSLVVMATGAGLQVVTAATAAGLVGRAVGGPVPQRLLWAATAVGVAACLVVAVRPAVLGLVTRLARRLPRLGSLPGAPAAGPVRRALACSLGAWVAFGLHLWLVAAPLGMAGGRGLVTATGAFALAWVVGFLIVLAPAGVGVREAELMVVLGPAVGTGGALAVSLASRFLVVLAEVVLALGAIALGRARSGRAERADPVPADPGPPDPVVSGPEDPPRTPAGGR